MFERRKFDSLKNYLYDVSTVIKKHFISLIKILLLWSSVCKEQNANRGDKPSKQTHNLNYFTTLLIRDFQPTLNEYVAVKSYIFTNFFYLIKIHLYRFFYHHICNILYLSQYLISLQLIASP